MQREDTTSSNQIPRRPITPLTGLGSETIPTGSIPPLPALTEPAREAAPSMPCPECDGTGTVSLLWVDSDHEEDCACLLCEGHGTVSISEFKWFASRNRQHYSKIQADCLIIEAGYCPDHMEPLDDNGACMTCTTERRAAA